LEPDELIGKLHCEIGDIERVRGFAGHILGKSKGISLTEAKVRLAGKKGLLIEDDPDFAKRLINDFKRIDADIKCLANTDAAVYLMADRRAMRDFDFTIVDIQLPRYEGGRPTKAAGEDLLEFIQFKRYIPPGVILTSLLSLRRNPINLSRKQIDEYMDDLLSRGFRPLRKKPSEPVEARWGYDLDKLCQLLGTIVVGDRYKLIKGNKGCLKVFRDKIHWMPKRKGPVTNRFWKEISENEFEIITTKRQRELLNEFGGIGTSVDYRDVINDIIRRYSDDPDNINMQRARITLFSEINQALKGTGLRLKAIRRDEKVKLCNG